MKIKKKLNNNVAVVTDKIGNEIIVMGKGITYDKKAGDCVDVRNKLRNNLIPLQIKIFNEISGNIIGYSIKIFRSQ